MTTTSVTSGQTFTNVDITSGNTLDIQSAGTANNSTIENGGFQIVEAGGTETGAIVRAGGIETVSGAINTSNVVTTSGSASGDDDFGTINIGSGGAISNVKVENGGTLNLIAKSASANGVTVLSGGLVTINGNAPANGVTLQGGTLELMSPKADTTNSTAGVPTASGTLTFASGTASRLQIDVAQTGSNTTTFAQTINGFDSDDTIDLKYLTASGATVTQTASGANTVVTVTGGGSSGSETFTFLNTTPGRFTTAADPTAGGVDLVETACYVAGTLIRTMRGEVAVEDLAVGDLVVTASGVARPIRWLGHRETDCRRHRRPREAWPIRIAAHAFGEQRPARDLWVSPGHAICVDVLGEALIPAVALVNGATVTQVEVDTVTYWHVELDGHDVMLAENMPAESYIDTGNRAFFVDAGSRRPATGAPARPIVAPAHRATLRLVS